MIIAVDFDGTIVKHRYPEIGPPVPDALETLWILMGQGHKIILYTMRSGDDLDVAVTYLEANGVDLYGVNENPGQRLWTTSPKVHADVYIDDAALGCPLHYDYEVPNRPYVAWEKVAVWLKNYGFRDKGEALPVMKRDDVYIADHMDFPPHLGNGPAPFGTDY